MTKLLILDTVWAGTIAISENKKMSMFAGYQYEYKTYYGNPVDMNRVIANKDRPEHIIIIINSWDFDTLGPFHDSRFDLSFADLVIFMSAELSGSDRTYCDNLADRINNKNCIFITAGYTYNNLTDTSMPIPEICYDYYWFDRVVEANTPIVYEIPVSKPFLFDALLGSKKWFRNEVFMKLASLNLVNSSLISLHDSHCDPHVNNIPSFETPALMSLEHEHIVAFKNAAKTELERYSGHSLPEYINNSGFKIRMSCLISEKIYENSWYSIITETNFDINVQFASEKTAKAFFARRIFVMLSAAYHLEWMRKLGFKTFDGIIDESYDTITNPMERVRAAMQQVLHLSNLDPVDTYNRAKPILDYNYNLMLKLQNKNYENLRKFIKPHLDKIR